MKNQSFRISEYDSIEKNIRAPKDMEDINAVNDIINSVVYPNPFTGSNSLENLIK